jgi:hypothetical protein
MRCEIVSNKKKMRGIVSLPNIKIVRVAKIIAE